jgi:hypothetical protein
VFFFFSLVLTICLVYVRLMCLGVVLCFSFDIRIFFLSTRVDDSTVFLI